MELSADEKAVFLLFRESPPSKSCNKRPRNNQVDTDKHPTTVAKFQSKAAQMNKSRDQHDSDDGDEPTDYFKFHITGAGSIDPSLADMDDDLGSLLLDANMERLFPPTPKPESTP
ncbi:hypothetical protein [Aporhodopirellula aestuarii]|uniref:Uncharacterized protein n=1 Tax=Aporhodopirellula aestuarii TaxID=2950107 RepID=A0ABT0UCL2_9BACT|nr:hypothetical protein [Aporhodopirellula aestuarii]MCM2374655.1 hypothetical protein [Aporhodopirellula aestuarii]